MPRPKNNNSQPDSRKYLNLKSVPNDSLGKVIAYLQNHSTNTQVLAGLTLVGRFLPFAIDPDDPDFRAIAIQSAEDCESWARAIRKYAGLNEEEATSNIRLVRENSSSQKKQDRSDFSQEEIKEEEVKEEETIKRPQAGKELLKSMGLGI